MTNEEAINILTRLLIDEYGCSLDKYDYAAIQHAVINLWMTDTYKWHDLRKNPEDMPVERKSVLYAVTDHYGFTEYEAVFCDAFQSVAEYIKKCGAEVIAWKYIEPFEGESE